MLAEGSAVGAVVYWDCPGFSDTTPGVSGLISVSLQMNDTLTLVEGVKQGWPL